jgi:hypothetical protein
MSYHYNTHHIESMCAAHLLNGQRDEQSVVSPAQIRRSAVDAVNRDAVAADEIRAGRAPEVCGPVLVVRWSIQHRKNDRGSHILHQPRIVGFVPARNAGEPVHFIPWGTRARRLAKEWRRERV